MTMKKKLPIAVVIGVCLLLCQNISQAQTVQDRLISSTFKALAKTYISTSDFNKLKENTLQCLAQIDTESFHQKYPRTLQLINDSPALTKQFGLRSDMSVAQARAFIKSLDKKKVSALIDAVPDQVVSRHVMEDISRASKSVNSKNIMDQVSAVWGNLQYRLDQTTKKSVQ
jgi:hypothetical protein